MTNTIRNMRPPESTSSVIENNLNRLLARKRGLVRTLQALFREHLLDSEQLIFDNSVAWLPIWSEKALIRFEGLVLCRMGSCQLADEMTYHKAGAKPYHITTPTELLSFVINELSIQVSLEDLKRLYLELENSIDNDALCLTYRQQWGQKLQSERGEHQSFLSAVRSSIDPNSVLMLEQWGTIGHPSHPTHKTKLGLSVEEVIQLSPEFQAQLTIPVAAIKKSVAHTELTLGNAANLPPQDYQSWFAATFPEVFQTWQHELETAGLNSDDWLPLPMHPYQAERFIAEEFVQELQQGDLRLLKNTWIAASPTMSFRTVVPERSATLPHLKLPVSLRLTSAERTVSAKSAVMGPRITELLQTILTKEAGFLHCLDIVGESVGLHYIDPDGNDDRSRHLSILYRQNPTSKRTAELFPLPVGSLFSDSPYDGQSLIAELVTLGFGESSTAALAFFNDYAYTVLTATLSAYLLYGIAFEAHQQNSFMVVDTHYRPVCLLIRDFGDVRVHAPTLQSMGLRLDAYRTGHTVFEDHEPVRDKILHAMMVCHLGEMALLLARTYQQSEGLFWAVLRLQTQRVFAELKPRTQTSRWESERIAFLESPWPSKALLRMRLSDTQDDVHGLMPNPLMEH